MMVDTPRGVGIQGTEGNAMFKTILILAFVVIMGAILVNRQRVFLRDPIATVYRNDVEQHGVEVYQNYSNDILVQKDGSRILVQNWNETPGTPVHLTCMRWMACLTDADQAQIIPIAPARKPGLDPRVSMTKTEITFVDADKSKVRVVLR
jgi:hypothetical protein